MNPPRDLLISLTAMSNEKNPTNNKPANETANESGKKDNSAPTNNPAPPADPPAATAAEATYSKADLEKAIADAMKAKDDEVKKAQEREKLSKEERLQLELDESRRENAMIKAEGEVVAALKAAGAKSPQLLFEAKRGALEFKDGKLTNLTEIVASLKLTYADQFGEIEKPKETINGGTGQQEKKERAETLGGALKQYYKK